MADVADDAEDYNERLVADSLAARRSIKPKAVPRGECLQCGEPVEGVFCDPRKFECRKLYEMRQKLSR